MDEEKWKGKKKKKRKDRIKNRNGMKEGGGRDEVNCWRTTANVVAAPQPSSSVRRFSGTFYHYLQGDRDWEKYTGGVSKKAKQQIMVVHNQVLTSGISSG